MAVDAAFAYRNSAAFLSVINAHGITQTFIRPHCPWTNGKDERLNRTLATEWAYARPYASNAQRAAALPTGLDYYNLDRAHLVCPPKCGQTRKCLTSRFTRKASVCWLRGGGK